MRSHIITAALLLAPFAMLSAQDTSTTQTPQRDSISGYNTPRGNMGQRDSMGDNELVMRIHRINQMEIKAGQLAQRNGSSAKVKSYGQQLVRDHQAADQKLTTLARSMGITLSNDSLGQGEKGQGQYGDQRGRQQQGRDTTMGQGRDTSMSRQGQGRDTLQGRYGQQDTTQGRFGQRGDSAWQHQQGEMQEQQKLQRLSNLRGKEFDTEFANLMAQGHDKAIKMLEQAQSRVQKQELRTFIAQTLPTLRVHLQVAQSLGGSTTTTTTSSIQ
jgi:predicted outer membrane protein